ncbi:MAG: Cytochrome b5-like Heme/Steroid binding protein [Candidatus Adlerbacteria bacterium]|nr:Cytochrome b5-like Heme/Steroid binding protein [Candidatus Adlerbacteria bacterium]
MSTKILGLVGFVAIVVFSAAFYMRTPEMSLADAPQAAIPVPKSSVPTSSAPDSTTKPTAPAKAPVQTPTASPYTMAAVATHNSAASCWSVVNGKVYDLTSWINQHPGGKSAILSMCGRDGSAAFNGQHGGERRPESELASFYLAALAQ